MLKYRYDTHVHTLETSMCGRFEGKDVVRLYKNSGYDGIVITDHYFDGFFNQYTELSWNEKIEEYLKGYNNAKVEGLKSGLEVILGIEITFNENLNDYLVFGIDEEFLLENKELYKLNLESFKDLIKDKDILLYQAHPFRPYITPVDPKLLDGVEVYNGNARHNSNNHLALDFAKSNNLKISSGSDFHHIEDLARGGIILDRKISNSFEFVKYLRETSDLELITA